MSLRLLLVDDHALFRQSLNVLLTAHGYEVVGMASNGFEALALARQLRPDLILMDIEMPDGDGLTATRLIKAEMPDVTIVMLTVSTTDEHLFNAIKSGASGYLLKSQSADQFLLMVAQVAEGGAALPPDLAARLLREFARQSGPVALPDEPPVSTPPAALTPRQFEILTLLAQGLTYAQMGGVLHLSEPTIRYHVKQIMERLHLDNRAQVIAYAAQHGLTPPTND
ncbi:MAG: response regulator transcription factor [Anaerolineales bacterium]|nr:response regulator transcription factor [Anaerolineales bacterium]